MRRTEWGWQFFELANVLAWGQSIIHLMVYTDHDIGDEDAHVDCDPQSLRRETHRDMPGCPAYAHKLRKVTIGWP